MGSIQGIKAPRHSLHGGKGGAVTIPLPCASRRWSSNPPEKCSYERPTRGTVCSTMRGMCGAGAGCPVALCLGHQRSKLCARSTGVPRT